MATLNPHLTFNGNCEEAFNFYKSVFGGDFLTTMRFKDMPGENNPYFSSAEKILHVAIPIGDSILMGCDVPDGANKMTFGDNINISFAAKSKEDADRVYNELSAGGKGYMPMENAFWGSYFGMLQDKYGIKWMISYDAPQQ